MVKMSTLWRYFLFYFAPAPASASASVQSSNNENQNDIENNNNLPALLLPEKGDRSDSNRTQSGSAEGSTERNEHSFIQRFSSSMELRPTSGIIACATVSATLILSAIISLVLTALFLLLDILTYLMYSLSLDNTIDDEKMKDFLFIHGLASLISSFIVWNVFIVFGLVANRYAHDLNEYFFPSIIRLFVCSNFFMPMLSDLFLEKALGFDQPNALDLTWLCKGLDFSLVCAVLFCLYISKGDRWLISKITNYYLDLEKKLETKISEKGVGCFCYFFSGSQDEREVYRNGDATPVRLASVRNRYDLP